MTTKEHIIEEIRRIARMRGGHVSIRAFVDATGIPEHQILVNYWATWNEALAEAGATTISFFQPKIEEGLVIEALAKLTDRLKKWPTQRATVKRCVNEFQAAVLSG